MGKLVVHEHPTPITLELLPDETATAVALQTGGPGQHPDHDHEGVDADQMSAMIQRTG